MRDSSPQRTLFTEVSLPSLLSSIAGAATGLVLLVTVYWRSDIIDKTKARNLCFTLPIQDLAEEKYGKQSSKRWSHFVHISQQS